MNLIQFHQHINLLNVLKFHFHLIILGESKGETGLKGIIVKKSMHLFNLETASN